MCFKFSKGVIIAMTINSVSFGKVTLIKAPLEEAQKIADIANRNEETKLAKDVKQVINDTQDGPARAFSFNPSIEKSYIFSGKEGQDFWKAYCTAKAETDYIKTYCSRSKSADTKIKKADEELSLNVNRIITSSQYHPIINVEHDEEGEISTVNINA